MASIVRVQPADFDVGAEVASLRAGQPGVGAVAVFIGTVRDLNDGSGVSALTLEHYPGMTERSLARIADEAHARWRIQDCLVVHRVGELMPLDQIVMVAVTSAHRGDAFSACEFVMDYLKTRAPFWKKERTPQGERWVDARASDDEAAARWAGAGAAGLTESYAACPIGPDAAGLPGSNAAGLIGPGAAGLTGPDSVVRGPSGTANQPSPTSD